jgi:hypothetical protein
VRKKKGRTVRLSWRDPAVRERRTIAIKGAWDRRKARIRELEASAKRKKPGAKPSRAAIFAEAHRLHQLKVSWSKIARLLIPDEYKLDTEKAARRLKEGVRYWQS